MIFKVSFKETEKSPSRIVEKKGRTTTVTLKGVVRLPVFWSKVPDDIMEWIAVNPYVELYEDISDNTLLVFSSGKARCMPGDRYDTVLGERIAEARAKYDIYKFFYSLTCKLHDYYNVLLFGTPVVDNGDGNCITQDAIRYERLLRREAEHIMELTKDKGNG